MGPKQQARQLRRSPDPQPHDSRGPAPRRDPRRSGRGKSVALQLSARGARERRGADRRRSSADLASPRGAPPPAAPKGFPAASIILREEPEKKLSKTSEKPALLPLLFC